MWINMPSENKLPRYSRSELVGKMCFLYLFFKKTILGPNHNYLTHLLMIDFLGKLGLGLHAKDKLHDG
jgi:hypothetical protein